MEARDWRLRYNSERVVGMMPNFQKNVCSTKVLYEEALLWDPTPYPSVYHFWQKKYPFWTPSIDKCYPFHIPSLESCIPFNCCKSTLFKIWIDHKTRTFCQLFHSYKVHLLALLGLLTTKMTDFPTLSHSSTNEIPTNSYHWSLKKVPLCIAVEPPCISRYQEPMGSGHFREYPPGEKSSLYTKPDKRKTKTKKSYFISAKAPHNICIHVFYCVHLYHRGWRKLLTPDNSIADE